ncbi:MAG: LamG domain-containing protein [Pseudomonadales bacterium]
MKVIHRDTAVPDQRASKPMRWICILLMLFAVSACVRSEDAVQGEDDANAPINQGTTPTDPGGTPPTDPGGTPPGDTPPPDDEVPPPVDPDPPIDPPEVTDVQLFEQTLFPLLRDPANFCAGCHGAAQIPLFAVADLMDAYTAITTQQKVDLQNPANSRVYLRAAEDRHNCGGIAACDQIAMAFLAAIQSWADQAAPPTSPAAQTAVSMKTTFANAQEITAARVDVNAVAKYLFDEGSGNTAGDSTGNAITLQIANMEWVSGGGLRNVNGKAQASVDDSRKLFEAIDATKAYSVEAWVIPENTAQDGPARIVSLSIDTATRNFTMGQNAIYYQLRNRSAGTGANGTPALEALDPQVDTVLQHVVMTFTEAEGRKIFINGQLSLEENAADTLDWQDNQILVLGNEVTDDRPWAGELKMVAIHQQALSAAEVQQNFDAGLGNLTSLRFDISEAIGAPAEVEMIAAELDSKAYLFAKPRYISDVTDVQIKNIRIAVNDVVPVAAQAFRRVDMQVTANGTELSPLGAVIPTSMGPEMDELHLVFEVLGNAQGAPEAIAPATPPQPLADTPDPEFAVRSFSQINDTMATLTGIDSNSNAIVNLYGELRGSLPATPDLLSYGQSQQVAIQRLANGYCDQIVTNSGRCNDFFGACEISAGGKAQVATTLFDRFVGVNLANQPMQNGVTTEIVQMIDDLGCAGGCNGAAGEETLSASCAAVLSSAAITLQ